MPPNWKILSSSKQPPAPNLSGLSDQDRFWALVATARAAAGSNNDTFLKLLTKQLKSLSPEAIMAFKVELDRTQAASYRWDLWGAAFVIMGGCSDDMFEYFRAWLVTMGHEMFDQALADPDSLADLDLGDEPDETCDLELLLSAANEVYEKKTGRDLYDNLPETAPHADEPQGQSWEEDQLESLFPRLWAKYGC